MKRIIVKSLNRAGDKALGIHEEGMKKINRMQKMQFKLMGYSYSVISKNPFEVELLIKNPKYADNPLFMDLIIGEVQTAMTRSGAEEKDYKIQIS